MAKKKKKEPQVIEHQPKPVAPTLFVVEIEYKSGRTRTFTDVLSTVTDHRGTFDHKENTHTPAVVPYDNYMIVQQSNRTSTYVNMDAVEDLTIEVQPNG